MQSIALLLWLSFCSVWITNAFSSRGKGLFSQLRNAKFRSSLPMKVSRLARALDTVRKGVTDTGAVFLLPPIAIYILATSQVRYSPLNKQAIAVRGPFFQGWLVRCIDHTTALSFILIVGSFSMTSARDYTQHYVFFAANKNGKHHCVHAFPHPSSVTVSDHKNAYLDITWQAKDLGSFQFNSTMCQGKFDFIDGTAVQFESHQRIPWKPKDKVGFVGPEGWLGLTSLLPCHYFVHTVGSTTSYRLQAPRVGDVSGVGYSHIEGNYGTFFPEGWTWAQGIAEDNKASFSLVLGRFVIGAGSPINCVAFLRRGNGKTAVIRTTDVDRIKYSLDGKERTVFMQGQSALKGFILRLTIRTTDSSAHRVFIPTCNGFSNQPGCVETYTAVATVSYQGVDAQEEEVYQFPLTALEFGGSFIQSIHGNA